MANKLTKTIKNQTLQITVLSNQIAIVLKQLKANGKTNS